MKKQGLGKGLSGLIASQRGEVKEPKNAIVNIDVNDIEPGKFQPRKFFHDEALEELADSIKRHGIIQPIVLRKAPDSSKYEIVAGERRWRAAKEAELQEVPAIIKEIHDAEMAEQALIENIQREDLNTVEEAQAYLELMTIHSYKQEELASSLGKSRVHIANMLRITMLPLKVKEYILLDKLSYSHAKIIASLDDVEDLAREIVEKNLSVKQTEKLARKWKKPTFVKKLTPKLEKDNNKTSSDDLESIAVSLTERLGMKVTIDSSGSKGKLTIHYGNYEQLDNIVEKLV